MDYFFCGVEVRKRENWYWVSVNQKKLRVSYSGCLSVCLCVCIMLSARDPIINKAINQVGAFN